MLPMTVFFISWQEGPGSIKLTIHRLCSAWHDEGTCYLSLFAENEEAMYQLLLLHHLEVCHAWVMHQGVMVRTLDEPSEVFFEAPCMHGGPEVDQRIVRDLTYNWTVRRPDSRVVDVTSLCPLLRVLLVLQRDEIRVR